MSVDSITGSAVSASAITASAIQGRAVNASSGGGPTVSNPILLTHFDGPGFIDESSNNFTGSAVGDANIGTTRTKFGAGSASFDGNGDAVKFATAASNVAFNNTAWTLSMWVWFNDSANRYVCGSYNGGAAGHWQLLRPGAGDYLQFNIRDALNSVHNPWFSDSTVTSLIGDFHLITLEQYNDKIYGYVDGTLEGTPYNVASVDLSTPWPEDFHIGGRGPFSTDAAKSLSGNVDEALFVAEALYGGSNFTPPDAPYVIA